MCSSDLACETALLKMIEFLLPAQSAQLFGKSGWLPMNLKPSEIWEQIKQATLVDSKIDAEAIGTRKRLEKQRPKASAGNEAYFVDQRQQVRRLEFISAPISAKELQAATKAAFAKPGICAKSTLKGVLSKAKATEAARARSNPSCMAGGAASECCAWGPLFMMGSPFWSPLI